MLLPMHHVFLHVSISMLSGFRGCATWHQQAAGRPTLVPLNPSVTVTILASARGFISDGGTGTTGGENRSFNQDEQPITNERTVKRFQPKSIKWFVMLNV